MYRCIIFDLDGTLADTDFMVVDAYLKMFKKYRPDYKPSFKELASFSGPTLKDVFNDYFKGNDIESLLNEFRDISLPMYFTHTGLYKGIKECLEEFKSAGLKLCVVTNKISAATKVSLMTYGIYNLFDLIISSDNVKNGKPDPEGILKCISQLGFSKEEVLYIGDSKIDELACKNASVDCCLVTWNLHGKIKGTNPKYTISKVNDLKEIVYG